MSHQVYSNAAGGPLPAIPRRPSNSRSASSPAQPSMKRATKSPCRMHRSSSCSDSEGHSASAHSSSQAPGGPLTLRTRRVRGPHPPTFPESVSTSPLADAPSFGSLRASKTEDNIALASHQGPKVYAPGMLKLSQSSASTPDMPKVASRPPEHPGYIRKKSGQLVKPSLKTSKSAGNVTFSSLASSSKSEPATPVCKAVHFDSQLEHVKLFLAEQKPRAVSRDGSPTDDTSGTDSDFPSFMFGGDSTARRRGKLSIDVVNMPPRVNTYADVVLEKLWISPDNTSILGLTRVRNIAFAKLVAVRFTFDSWQTTSEVTARYQESISPEFDRFTFAIKLTDLLARIEKTLILAVRYTVAGQELWDNNHTLNYVGKFTRSIRDRSLSDEEGDTKGNLESLQNKLEKVKEGSERTGPAFVAQAAVAVEADTDGPTFKSTSSFASRYDFSASLRNPWKYQESQPSRHRHNSFPQMGNPPSFSDAALSPRATSPVKPVQVLGSPRDMRKGPVPTSITDDASSVVTSRPEAQSRNHRRGYFDIGSFNAMSVKMTPPASPPSMRALDDDVPSLDSVVLGEPLRPKPVPSSQALAVDVSVASFGLFMGGDDFDSELSTPSLATPSSSRETTPSPTERFADLPLGSDASHDYRDLINQYCFFTGPESIQPDKSKIASYDSLKPADSDRTPEATPTLAPQPRLAAGFSPHRSSSADDIASMKSTTITPTTSTHDFHVFSDSESRSATPVPMAAPV